MEWAKEFPEHIRLTPYQIERLEIIRSALAVSNQEFHFHILTHAECSKMLQRELHRLLKDAHLGMPDEFYLLQVLASRLETARISNTDLFGLAATFPSSVPIEDQRLVTAMVSLIRSRRWHTIDDLANAIADDEAKLPEYVAAPVDGRGATPDRADTSGRSRRLSARFEGCSLSRRA